MARVSFSLRRDPAQPSEQVGVGSFNRGTPDLQAIGGAVGLDEDAALRSTGIITTIPTTVTSVFEANATDYNTVNLLWTLSDPFVDITDISFGETGLLGIVLVYSKTGFPETVQDGVVVLPSSGGAYSTSSAHNHQETIQIQTDLGTVDVLVPASGRWAYYSLFGYYNENGALGTYYYNKLASLEVLLPQDYSSTAALWSRIPKYYRELDTDTNNQLFRYVRTFGFELDRTRTLIDSVMTQYDPLLAESEAIDQLARMLGLEISIDDLGVTRTRALLHDIGFLRRTKGTLDSIVGYITAIGGSTVDVVTSGSAPYYTFKVHAQRANLVANPRFVGNLNWSVASQNTITVDSSAPEGVTITAGGSNTYVAIRSSVGVPADSATSYYTSINIVGDYEEVFEPLWHTGASWNSWGSVATTDEIDLSDLETTRYGYLMGAAASTGIRYPVFIVSLLAGQSITVNRWMVEPNNYGTFFDGDTVFGGYLYQNQSADHLWSDSSQPRNSYSTYTANRKPTQDTITRVLPKIIPVTLLGGITPKYAIDYNWVPGKT